MATSGSFENAFRAGYKIKVDWIINSQNVVNNTSNVTFTVKFCSTGSSYYINSTSTKYGSLTINGTKYSFTFSASLSGNQTKTVYTKTMDITHDSNGTKTLTIATSLSINVTLSGVYWGTVTANGTGNLNSIVKTSTLTLSATSMTLGQSVELDITKAKDSYCHRIIYNFGNISAEIYKGNGNTYTLTRIIDDATQIPNSTSGTANIVLETYTDSTYSTKIGSTSNTLIIKIPSTLKPTFTSLTASPVNTTDSSAYIKGKSKCSLTITGASGTYGSTIQSYSITGGGFSGTASNYTTGLLNLVGEITFSAIITDSRGIQSDKKTITINVLDYEIPSIILFEVNRCDENGNIIDDGTFLNVSVDYSYSELDNNTITSKVYYKNNKNNEEYIQGATITQKGTYVVGDNDIDIDASFDVMLQLQDNYTTISKTLTVPTAFVTMSVKSGGKGIAFGKVAEEDSLLDINMNMRVRGNLYIDNSSAMIWNGSLSGTDSITLENAMRYNYIMIAGKPSGATCETFLCFPRIFIEATDKNIQLCTEESYLKISVKSSENDIIVTRIGGTNGAGTVTAIYGAI